MKELGKHVQNIGAKGLESKKGERRCLPSSSTDTRSPFLDFNLYEEVDPTQAAIGYLAEILVEIYFYNQHARAAKKKGSNLLPGINKRTG